MARGISRLLGADASSFGCEAPMHLDFCRATKAHPISDRSAMDGETDSRFRRSEMSERKTSACPHKRRRNSLPSHSTEHRRIQDRELAGERRWRRGRRRRTSAGGMAETVGRSCCYHSARWPPCSIEAVEYESGGFQIPKGWTVNEIPSTLGRKLGADRMQIASGAYSVR
ncbi:hypothetical protein SEVIR_4G018950v4 [Setaria viridis]